ncbi:uncharacterized protein LOC108917563 isoform X2 [Anoplophora glabripennis]|uniref:uncharacterized protein LOC108917563 isoform X2 n=1 Tax=Anoplophora glabripennis TaxID=217634 RepID=UPI0008753051|nr:uncharacterized protein LOC108917563 isoform X2 [Anoplophora glabripennis]
MGAHIMRMPVYLVCAAALVAVKGEEGTNYFGRQLEPVDVAADQETISYLLPKLAAKYRPSNDWSGVTDPRFYVLTEMESNDIDNQITKPKKIRNKRYNYDLNRPSLSIQAPIQSLRNAYAKEKLRQRLEDNRRFLANLVDIQ